MYFLTLWIWLFLVPHINAIKQYLSAPNPDAGKDWGKEEKRTTEDEMVGCHHRLDGHGFGSGSWWWIGRPGVLWFMGSQRAGHDWATELMYIVSWSWNSNTVATWCKELTHWKRPQCWERLKAGGEGDDRGVDGWMASPTQWTWVWASSRSWELVKQGNLACCSPWGHKALDMTERLNWTECILEYIFKVNLMYVLQIDCTFFCGGLEIGIDVCIQLWTKHMTSENLAQKRGTCIVSMPTMRSCYSHFITLPSLWWRGHCDLHCDCPLLSDSHLPALAPLGVELKPHGLPASPWRWQAHSWLRDLHLCFSLPGMLSPGHAAHPPQLGPVPFLPSYLHSHVFLGWPIETPPHHPLGHKHTHTLDIPLPFCFYSSPYLPKILYLIDLPYYYLSLTRF